MSGGERWVYLRKYYINVHQRSKVTFTKMDLTYNLCTCDLQSSISLMLIVAILTAGSALSTYQLWNPRHNPHLRPVACDDSARGQDTAGMAGCTETIS